MRHLYLRYTTISLYFITLHFISVSSINKNLIQIEHNLIKPTFFNFCVYFNFSRIYSRKK